MDGSSSSFKFMRAEERIDSLLLLYGVKYIKCFALMSFRHVAIRSVSMESRECAYIRMESGEGIYSG